MTMVSGTVEQKSPNGKGLKIQGAWFNTGKPELTAGIEPGMNVEIKTSNGKFFNTKPTVVGGAAAPTGGASGGGGYQAPKSDLKISKDRCIVRQNALAHATRLATAEIATGGSMLAELIIEEARKFEAYSMGDDDAGVLNEMMSQ